MTQETQETQETQQFSCVLYGSRGDRLESVALGGVALRSDGERLVREFDGSNCCPRLGWCAVKSLRSSLLEEWGRTERTRRIGRDDAMTQMTQQSRCVLYGSPGDRSESVAFGGDAFRWRAPARKGDRACSPQMCESYESSADSHELTAPHSRPDHHSSQRSGSFPQFRPEIDSMPGGRWSEPIVAFPEHVDERACAEDISRAAHRPHRLDSILGLLAAITNHGEQFFDDGGTDLGRRNRIGAKALLLHPASPLSWSSTSNPFPK